MRVFRILIKSKVGLIKEIEQFKAKNWKDAYTYVTEHPVWKIYSIFDIALEGKKRDGSWKRSKHIHL